MVDKKSPFGDRLIIVNIEQSHIKSFHIFYSFYDLLIFCFFKDYLLQPLDLPCPSDVLHQLYSHYKPAESQFLSVKGKFITFCEI